MAGLLERALRENLNHQILGPVTSLAIKSIESSKLLSEEIFDASYNEAHDILSLYKFRIEKGHWNPDRIIGLKESMELLEENAANRIILGIVKTDDSEILVWRNILGGVCALLIV